MNLAYLLNTSYLVCCMYIPHKCQCLYYCQYYFLLMPMCFFLEFRLRHTCGLIKCINLVKKFNLLRFKICSTLHYKCARIPTTTKLPNLFLYIDFGKFLNSYFFLYYICNCLFSVFIFIMVIYNCTWMYDAYESRPLNANSFNDKLNQPKVGFAVVLSHFSKIACLCAFVLLF